MLLQNHTNDSEIGETLVEVIKEFFTLVDFNGDGSLSDDEIIDLDENVSFSFFL